VQSLKRLTQTMLTRAWLSHRLRISTSMMVVSMGRRNIIHH
jgi:hypothetical protein